jgi:hypothetical protein
MTFILASSENNILREPAQRVSKILLLTREDKSHISSSHRVMFCLLYRCPKQKIVKFHAQKQIGKSHVIDIFTSRRYGKYLTVYFSVSHYLQYIINCILLYYQNESSSSARYSKNLSQWS